MKKLLNALLTILITIFICLFCISFCIRDIVVNTISKEIVGKELSSMISELARDFSEDVDYDALKEIEMNVINNPSITEITGKYFDGIINSVISNEEIEVPNIKEDIINLINDNEAILKEYNIEITEEQKQEIIDEIANNEKIDEVYKEAVSSLKNEMTDEEVMVLKVYDKMTSREFRLIVLSIILILTLLIALIKKSLYRWTYNLAFALALAGIAFALIAPYIISYIPSLLAEESLNGTPIININSLVNMGYGCFALCALCIIIYVVSNIITKHKNKEYNY